MECSRFDECIARVNAEDASAFGDFLAANMHMQNGTPHDGGVRGMQDRHAKIGGRIQDTLQVADCVTDRQRLVIRMRMRIDMSKGDEESPLGPVRRGERFDHERLILRQIRNARLQGITVCCLDFTRTGADGVIHHIGTFH